jgi:SAM-dependent methyltransferase
VAGEKVVKKAELATLFATIVEQRNWGATCRPGLPGYSLPLPGEYDEYSLTDDVDRETLRGKGVNIGEAGIGSLLYLNSNQTNLNVQILGGGSRSRIFLGPCRSFTGVFQCLGDDAMVVFAGSPGEPIGLSADLINDRATMYVGAGGVCYGVRGTIESENSIVIGDGCLMSDQIELRGSDSHAIIAFDSGRVINAPGSILLEPRVWIAQGVVILKNVIIGHGSIVATRSVVTRNVPPFCLVAGVPARVTRTAVSWHRSYPSSIADCCWEMGSSGFVPATDAPRAPMYVVPWDDQGRPEATSEASLGLDSHDQVNIENEEKVTSRSEVELCYRILLGREPESTAIVDELTKTYRTISALRLAMLHSDEFKTLFESINAVGLRPLSSPRNHVEVVVAPEYLKKMMGRVEASWEELGKSEPFWSVLVQDRFLLANLKGDTAEFYASGSADVELFFSAAARAGIAEFDDLPVCMEYGCGIGRLTVWLAERFKNVIACDISQPHLDNARVVLNERGIDNIELVKVAAVDEVAKLRGYDVFFSVIVLQHNPPPIAAYIIEQSLHNLNPGGLAYFQIPTYRLDYQFTAREYVEDEGQHGMEMHIVPQIELFKLFARCGCSVLEVREDDRIGDPRFVSNSFLLQKPHMTQDKMGAMAHD